MDIVFRFELQLTHRVKMVIRRGCVGQRMWVITGTEVLDINGTTAAWFHTGRCYNSTETGADQQYAG